LGNQVALREPREVSTAAIGASNPIVCLDRRFEANGGDLGPTVEQGAGDTVHAVHDPTGVAEDHRVDQGEA
jgi:hypothetical protein